jgi:hypothetical protein
LSNQHLPIGVPDMKLPSFAQPLWVLSPLSLGTEGINVSREGVAHVILGACGHLVGIYNNIISYKHKNLQF